MADTKNFLDLSGVSVLWSKIKLALADKVDKETGKGLSSNDYTSDEKTKLANVASGAQVNVLEGIQKNGTTVSITNKIANITVPTKTSDLTNDSNFAVDSAYVHTDNNYTTAEKNKLVAVEANADVNVIETVKVNGTALTPDANKAVDVAVPTKTSDITNDSNFVTSTNVLTKTNTTSYTPTENYHPTTKKYVDDSISAADDVMFVYATFHSDSNGDITSYSFDKTYSEIYNHLTSGNIAYLVTGNILPVYQYNKSKITFVDVSVNSNNKKINQTFYTISSSDVVTRSFNQLTVSSPSSATPLVDGTAAVGSSDDYARGDHVHPHDSTKVDKVTGKGLSTNDFTDALKDKLDAIAEEANKYELPTATASILGGIKVGSNLSIDANGVLSADAQHIDVDTAMSASSTNPVQNKVINTALGLKANLASPALTGTPTAPTAAAGTNTTQIATTAFVTSAVSTAIGDLAGVEFSIVTKLPTTGNASTIYLVSASDGSGNDVYDEYIWLTANTAFEKIGTTRVDLSDYYNTSNMIPITSAQIDTVCT